MKRRFNYTNRKRIPRDKVQIVLKSQGANPPAFDAKIDLAELKLPADASVFVEAYYRTSYMRFDFGTVARLRCDQDRTLRDIENRQLIHFRVKVTDATGEHGKLLAEVDGLIPNPTDGLGHRLSILEVKFEDLGNLAWRVDLTDNSMPTLVVNRKIDNKEYIHSDATFFALVYPAVIREILTNILSEEGYEYDPNSNDWKDLWIRYTTNLAGAADPPGENEPEACHEWIEDAIRLFCDRQAACQLFLDAWAKEGGA